MIVLRAPPPPGLQLLHDSHDFLFINFSILFYPPKYAPKAPKTTQNDPQNDPKTTENTNFPTKTKLNENNSIDYVLGTHSPQLSGPFAIQTP